MLDKNFDNTLELWSTELDNYDFEKLLLKPDAKSWSLGLKDVLVTLIIMLYWR